MDKDTLRRLLAANVSPEARVLAIYVASGGAGGGEDFGEVARACGMDEAEVGERLGELAEAGVAEVSFTVKLLRP